MFKDTLQKAIKLHKEMTGEIITDKYVAAIIWDKTYNEPTRRNSMQRAYTMGIKKPEYILKLNKIFPHTPLIEWLKIYK